MICDCLDKIVKKLKSKAPLNDEWKKELEKEIVQLNKLNEKKRKQLGIPKIKH